MAVKNTRLLQMITMGLFLGFLFGLFDVLVDTYLFGENQSILHEIFSPTPMEVYIRSFVLLLFIIFGAVSGHTMSSLEKIRTELELEITKRTKVEENLLFIANHDYLTSLYNRRSFDEHLELAMQQAVRYQQPLSLLMCDLDNFKKVNDLLGHSQGDQVLIEFSRLLQDSIRKSDLVCRYGGEEFSILTPQTSLEDATILAENIRKKTQSQFAREKYTVTVSIGIAQWDYTENKDRLYNRADNALYEAKKLGRNRIFFDKS